MKTDSPSHRSHFYLGLLAGGVIGAIIAYLSSHKKSGLAKKQLLLAAKRFSKHLPRILDQLANRQVEEEPKSAIQQEFIKLKNLITAEPEPPPPPTLSEKISQTVKKTTKGTQKFFKRAGKKLKK